MQCCDAQFYLRLRRRANDELGTDVSADLDRHLAGCPACMQDSRLINSFDSAVAAAMRSVPIPAGLREKLLTQALAHRGTILRRKAYRVAALAASLFLVTGVAFGLFSASRPKLDTDHLVMSTDEQIQDPDKAIERWLKEHHFPTQLPLPFNTDLLVSLGTERIQGKEVPVILFGGALERGGFAKVYIFHKNGEFKIDANSLRDAQASHTCAKVISGQDQIVYVILYTDNGSGLQPFLHTRSSL